VTGGQSAQRPYEVQHISLVVAGAGFQVREFTVAPGEEVPWHYHTEVTDWCYCLEGVVAAQTRDRAEPAAVTTARLTPGQSCRIDAGTVHRLANAGDVVCRYLLVQAGGQYDFNKVGVGAARAVPE
jgi:mannose-6-phosphate isomerase-like protein (cupin superfamily)